MTMNPIPSLFTHLSDWWRSRRLAKERAKTPATLHDAIEQIIAAADPADLEAFASKPRCDCMVGLHHGPGTAMRNSWNLWANDTPLTRWMTFAGVHHGDDRSGLIYEALWCRLNRVEFDLVAYVARITRHWAGQGVTPDGKDIPGFAKPDHWEMVRGPDGRWESTPVYEVR